MKTQNIFIDTDMGNDDIMALAYLQTKGGFPIVGISTVNGVSTKQNGIKNLSIILNYLDVSVPMCTGSEKALKERIAAFPQYDSNRANNLTLLTKLSLNKTPSLNNEEIAVEDFIYQKTANKNTTILALGPLTNIAKTIKKYKEKFTSSVEKIVLMGGGINSGNVPPLFAAEYNIFLDPEAADIVFLENIPIVMIGIDATNFVPATESFTKKVIRTSPKTKNGKIIKDIITNNTNDFSSFYDPLSVFLLERKDAVLEKMTTGISVILKGRNRGKTILNTKRSNVELVLSVDAQKFYADILQTLENKYI